MKKTISLLLFIHGIFTLSAQLVDFEEYDIEVDSFLNNAETQGPFTTASFTFPNDYNTEFDAWSGWAISNIKDNTTPGYNNQYSSITGSGKDNSQNYATTFVLESSWILNSAPLSDQVTGIHVTNATYPYLSIRDGDSFAKRFGGETGDDPDFFLLTIKGYEHGAVLPDSINFYLADYRFEDNSQDYIVDSWEFIDLEIFRTVDSLKFQLNSSDVGQFGMNTPSYFCIDNLEIEYVLNNKDISFAPNLKVFPNPSSDRIQLSSFDDVGSYQIFDFMGKKVSTGAYHIDIEIATIPTGPYFLLLFDKNNKLTAKARFVKE